MRRFIDISVPRNIAPGLGQLPGAVVYNVDDLKEVVAANKEERARAAAEAEVLLAEEQVAFEAWRDSLETVPTIKALRTKAETIRATELEKTLNKLGEGLTNKQKKVRGWAGGWGRDGWKGLAVSMLSVTHCAGPPACLTQLPCLPLPPRPPPPPPSPRRWRSCPRALSTSCCTAP